jgi:hypothetical protein
MNDWMLAKLKYTAMLENGTFKRVTRPYLFAAMSFSDCESRVYEELGSTIRGEFSVVSITRQDIHDIFHYEDCDVWYKGVISFVGSSEEGEKAKKVKQNLLVSATSVKDADAKLKESLSGMMVDYEIESITVTPIEEIFPYREALDREISRTEQAPEDYLETNAVDELN